MLKSFISTIILSLFGFSASAVAQDQTGESAARKYFNKRPAAAQPSSSQRAPGSSAGTPRYLSLHYGHSINDKSNKWGPTSPEEDIAKWNLGVTYRFGEWVNSSDFLLRVEFFGMKPGGKDVTKISFLPMLVFPDSNSDFPLYFGVAAGIGVITGQIDDESEISLDYQLLTGVRIFDLVDSWGFKLELGLKNHVHLLSSGQFGGVFLSVGSVTRF